MIRVTSYLLPLILLTISCASRADVSWSFDLDSHAATVSNNAEIPVFGVVTNSLTSTEPLVIPQPCDGCFFNAVSLVGSYQNVWDYYSLDEGPRGAQDLSASLAGASISPGNSLKFLFYTLVPIANLVPNGEYIFGVNMLSITYPAQSFYDGGAFTVSVVPEPTISSLLIVGIMGLFMLVHFRSR